MSLLVVGADHGGYAVKEDLKKAAAEAGWQIQDVGTNSTDAVDYPDFAVQVGLQVIANPGSLGLMVDGAGVGSAIAANKVPGIRAAVCNDLYTAKNAREHNHANVLCLGSMVVGQGVAREILKIFLTTKPGGDRHERRVHKIRQFEEAHSTAGATAGLVERVVRLVVEALAPAAGAPQGAGSKASGSKDLPQASKKSKSSTPVLTERDVLAADRSRPLSIAPGTIVTPQARDTAKSLGLRIVEESRR